MREKMILLSFDIEEFDGPREHGVEYSLEEGMKVSIKGTNVILDILKENSVKATFFCTGNFAENSPETMQRIIGEGHEIACHGVDHWQPKESDIIKSKEIVEKITNLKVTGYRQPRMFPTEESEIRKGRIPVQLIPQPGIHSGKIHEPQHTENILHQRRSDADSGIGYTMGKIPIILAFPAQPA